MNLLVASQNQKKLKELRDILETMFHAEQLKKINLVSLSEFPDVEEVV